MNEIKGSEVLQHAITEVKQKIKKKREPKSIIKLSKESKTIYKKSKFSLEKNDEEKGIIHISHIPHGFYEVQIKNFFKQFGSVVAARVARSKKTGRSKGYAFVLFKNASVAKIAAESMNNYLMCGRLLKVNFVPKEKQNLVSFLGENYHKYNYPRLHNVKAMLQCNRRPMSEAKLAKKTKIAKKKLTALEEKLKSKGVDLSFIPI